MRLIKVNKIFKHILAFAFDQPRDGVEKQRMPIVKNKEMERRCTKGILPRDGCILLSVKMCLFQTGFMKLYLVYSKEVEFVIKEDMH